MKRSELDKLSWEERGKLYSWELDDSTDFIYTIENAIGDVCDVEMSVKNSQSLGQAKGRAILAASRMIPLERPMKVINIKEV